MLDPTIKQYQDPKPMRWLFDLTLKNTGGKDLTCKGFRIEYAREAFQERAHIFANNETPPVLNGRRIPVIKDVYPFPGVDNGFSEVEIIENVHRNDGIPGVVRMVYAELVRYEDGSQFFWGDCRFWVLVWWMINAAPHNKPTANIERGLWEALTCDSRDAKPISFTISDLHPSYAPMINLLDDLSYTLQNDYHCAKDEPYNHPESLHEAFQRTVLNFLFEHKYKEFMNLPTSGVPRVPEEYIQTTASATVK